MALKLWPATLGRLNEPSLISFVKAHCLFTLRGTIWKCCVPSQKKVGKSMHVIVIGCVFKNTLVWEGARAEVGPHLSSVNQKHRCLGPQTYCRSVYVCGSPRVPWVLIWDCKSILKTRHACKPVWINSEGLWMRSEHCCTWRSAVFSNLFTKAPWMVLKRKHTKDLSEASSKLGVWVSGNLAERTSQLWSHSPSVWFWKSSLLFRELILMF